MTTNFVDVSLEAFQGPELIIGLVGPVGCDLSLVAKTLQRELNHVAYASYVIRVSRLLHEIKELKHSSGKVNKYDQISEHMDSGTRLRKETKHGDVLTLMSIATIREIRKRENLKNPGEIKQRESESDDKFELRLKNRPLKRTAFIIRSLKNPEEIKTLRKVYGRNFVAISVYKSREERITALAERISHSYPLKNERSARSYAEDLVARDEEEKDEEGLGQSVRNAFPLADFFVDSRSAKETITNIRRFIEIIFGYPYHTPTKDEYAMSIAQSTAYRSADMSRQVGAVIATREGDVISTGCNEVPKYGGGAYWVGDEVDGRDFRKNADISVSYRRNLLEDLIEQLIKDEVIPDGEANAVRQLLDSQEARVSFRKSKINDVIEFGRAVHAEMAALMSAVNKGIGVKSTSLFSTTFPCHLCARHIIASGIERVVYIEPYPKSLALTLYDDSIVVDPSKKTSNVVRFAPFVGVAPRFFGFAFSKKSARKTSDGSVVDWDPKKAEPALRRYINYYIELEDKAVGIVLPEVLKAGNFTLVSDGKRQAGE